jgi:hypothetical protein
MAVAQAGRGAELHAHAKQLLNILLRSMAIKAKYPALRKVGVEATLAAGSSTVILPSDFGAGSEYLMLGSEKNPINEKSLADFTSLGGFKAPSGRPTFYMIDEEAGLIRFNTTADQAYPVIPVYFKVPEPIPLTSDGDLMRPWFNDDDTLIEALIEKIYQFKQDEREGFQGNKVRNAIGEVRRGQINGPARMKLSPNRFK